MGEIVVYYYVYNLFLLEQLIMHGKANSNDYFWQIEINIYE